MKIDSKRVIELIDQRVAYYKERYNAEADMITKLGILEVEGELLNLKLDLMKLEIDGYVPHATLVHNTDPGDEQRVGVDL